MKRAIGVAFLVVSLIPLAAGPVEALAAYIHVNTSSDADAADGVCSLREAIIATNVGGGYRECPAGTTGTDTILFDVSIVNVGGQLPTITVPVYLGNTGGTRTQLHGPGSTTGLVFGSAADGSIVRNMYIENFATGIDLQSSDATITGNVIGPNSGTGLHVTGAMVTIGGANPRTPDICSGACNLISGNSTGIGGTMTGSIKGNLIGLNSQGNAAQANNYGIQVSGTVTIGGTTADERNVISGNTSVGILSTAACSCTIQGNYVGTDAYGTFAVPNAKGVWVYGGNSLIGYISTTVGGAGAGEGNLISGNSDAGIYSDWIEAHNSVSIYGNHIGLNAANGPLGNGHDGIQLGYGGTDPIFGVRIGSVTLAGAANVVAYNGRTGVDISGYNAQFNSVRGNSIHDNTGGGIYVYGNDGVPPPTITSTNPVGGTACANCEVDIYSDSSDEGATYEGTVVADGSGNWTFAGTPVGPHVTATATAGSADTSRFSTPAALNSPLQPDARIKKGTGALVGNDVYNTTGLNQTKSGSAAPGNTVKFGISIQNDGSAGDHFSVSSTGTAVSGYTIKYFRGSTNITAAVVAGTYTTPALAPGATLLITAKVKVTSIAAKGSSITRLVTVTSTADGTQQDAVKFIASRP